MPDLNYIPVVENAIRMYMKSYGFREQDLANKLGMSQSGVNATLKRGFGIRAAKRWSETFGFNPSFLVSGEGDLMLSSSDNRDSYNTEDDNTVPLLPIFAQAGHLTGWSEGIEEYECERIITPVKDVDMAVHIYGESMYPDFPNGSVVYVKRINPNMFIEWGKSYILDTTNGPLLKYLAPGHDDGFVKCISANHDPMYAPFEVSKTDILGIYRVVMCMAMK